MVLRLVAGTQFALVGPEFYLRLGGGASSLFCGGTWFLYLMMMLWTHPCRLKLVYMVTSRRYGEVMVTGDDPLHPCRYGIVAR